MAFLFTVFNLFGASQLWREMCPTAIIQAGSYASHFAGFLPTIDRSSATNLPVGARPRLVLHSKENIWHTISLIESRFRTGDWMTNGHLHPTSSRPCWAYPQTQE
jgi:hypothetical protein